MNNNEVQGIALDYRIDPTGKNTEGMEKESQTLSELS